MTGGSPKILLIDDDVKLCTLMQEYLGTQGMILDTVTTGKAGLDSLKNTSYDLVILDLMLPDMNGLEVLTQIRQSHDIPVLILSAQKGEGDRVVGLEMGAEDYVSKPFYPRELLARLRVIFRRQYADIPKVITLRGLTINMNSMEGFLDGRPLNLTSFEFRIMAEMIRHPGRVFTREQLMDCAAGRDMRAYDRTIDMHIASIRRKLEDSPTCPRYIKTIRGTGYILLKQPSSTENS